MTKVNQVIAVEKGIKNRTNEVMSKIYKAVQQAGLFRGFSKQYQPLEESGEQFPPEQQLVQKRVEDVITQAGGALRELFDVTLQKDCANCTATANVVVDGETIMDEVPATYLLFMEKQLTDLHTLVKTLPTLDPAEAWDLDENQGLYRALPRQTVRTKKVQQPLVLYPATDKHPAQTQLITEDVTIGHWSATQLSGAVSEGRKNKLLSRIEKLQRAVKFAREEANTSPAPEMSTKGLFEWLLK